MKPYIELKDSSMCFELPDGQRLILSQKDINQIATQLLAEMMVNNLNHVHIHKSSNIEKCHLLYKAITEQKMSKKMRDQYLMQISKLIENDSETTEPLSKNEAETTID